MPQAMNILQQHISLREISDLLAVSRATARRMLLRGGVKAVILCDGRNGTLRYLRSEVEDFLQRNIEK